MGYISCYYILVHYDGNSATPIAWVAPLQGKTQIADSMHAFFVTQSWALHNQL